MNSPPRGGKPSHDNPGGHAYLGLRALAKRHGRTSAEYLRLYALEGFLLRLEFSRHREDLILKGGVLLAAYDLRRPTADIDLAALHQPNDVEHTLQSIAAQVRFLSAQLGELDPQLLELIKQHPAGPALLAEAGVGPVVAAQLLISWSRHGRVRNEAAFASLAGVAPLETSSGQRSQHRLNRGGDRALNRALHTVAITRMRCHPETRAYEIRRSAEGKTHRDIRRSVKRALARRLYRTIEAATQLHQEVTLAA